MKIVIIDDTVTLSEVPESTPIFAKSDGKLCGMLVHEDDGWIIRIGGRYGCSGSHATSAASVEIHSLKLHGIRVARIPEWVAEQITPDLLADHESPSYGSVRTLRPFPASQARI